MYITQQSVVDVSRNKMLQEKELPSWGGEPEPRQVTQGGGHAYEPTIPFSGLYFYVP